jgi:triosephosphate isomerase
MKKILIINLKAYEEGTGERGSELSKVADSLLRKDVEIILAVQAADIKDIADNVSLPVFSQHLDPVGYGAHTGWILPESVKSAGAKGSLLNHSERRIDFEELEKSIKRCKELGLTTVVCADTPENAGRIAEFGPDYIAIEPPELIGGEVSVSNAKPEVVTESIKRVKPFGIPVLCGAGIKNKEVVKKAKELGVEGILVASGVVKSEKPEKAIMDLIEGFG